MPPITPPHEATVRAELVTNLYEEPISSHLRDFDPVYTRCVVFNVALIVGTVDWVDRDF